MWYIHTNVAAAITMGPYVPTVGQRPAVRFAVNVLTPKIKLVTSHKQVHHFLHYACIYKNKLVDIKREKYSKRP
ncbi:unnamed protein product [Ceratitis capitata]|uniref:(Mediterranean fruit fly) hypothetical protein n=1 Tax=Ceratitis capitata TaxID=7213 RepID=A0A811V4D9_CERCA|nr:unnamed protein product [Ceratitis capitata]